MRRHLLLGLLLALLAGAVPASAHEGHFPHRDTIQEVNFDFAGAVEAGERGTASGYGDAGRTYLPLRWCGTPRGSDDTAHAVYDASLPQSKMVYAYAADQPDRTAAWADLLQANASLISRFYAQQSGGLRAPRFDLGNSCGAQYLDIATVRLPEPRAYYADSFDRIEAAVNAALPRTSGQPRNYVILADKLSTQPAGYLWGQGTMWMDESKGTSNWNNKGGVASIIYVPQAQGLPGTDAAKDQGFWPEGFLHEMTHNFGGVQDGSPNSTQAGHCRDGRDVMCYADGGLSYSSTVCPAITSWTAEFAQMLDCGRDDYFSPAPVASSWLDTHLNTFDNVFNGDCPTLGDQCGGGVAPAVTGGPAVAGFTRTGSTLTAQLGTWSGDPQLSWEWEEEVSGTWRPYAHASATLTLGAAHVGRRYRVKVTAAGVETVVARSHPTAAVTSGSVTPVNDAKPLVTGLARNGATLTGSTGSWTNAQTYARQWFRYDGSAYEAIGGATGEQYVIVPDDVGRQLALRVQATSSTGTTVTAWSDPTATVVSPPVSDVAPTVSGTAKVSRTLSAGPGTWTSPWATTYAHQWQREVDATWQAIAGATAGTYAVRTEDAGRRLRVVVTATNEHGSTSAASEPTAPVVPLSPPVNVSPPVATGEAQQGKPLTVEGDAWTGATDVAVRWERRAPGGEWTAIDSATSRTYDLQAADVDAEVRAVVTATNDDGSTAAPTPARGPVVTSVAPESTAPPQVSGTARTGQTLTATTGTWLRAHSYSYQWQRSADGSWTAVPGADQAAYTPVQADAGRSLRVLVTATGWGGSTSAPSAATQPVTDPPVAQTAPAISGVAKVGETLTASPGTWLNALSYEYRWQRGDSGTFADIAGATAATYAPVAGDAGLRLRVLVTAVNATDRSEPAASPETETVAGTHPPQNLAPPVVTGTLYEGETLTAGGDDWTGATSTAVVWQRRTGTAEWAAIAGATERTHTLTAADLGADVRALVTATNEDGETAVASVPRGPVDGDPANVAPPAITGTPRVGKPLTATPGTWLRATSLAYAWQRHQDGDWTAIDGATGSTYTPVTGDAHLPLRVVVTGTGSRASASAASDPTAPVDPLQPPQSLAPPVVSGVLYEGETLAVASDEWSGATGTGVQWERRADGGEWTPIAGATARTHTLVSADVGHAVRASVTASNAAGDTTVASTGRGPVDGDPVNTALPQISGTPRVGQTLTATAGEWLRASTFAYRWQIRRNGEWEDIQDATQTTYSPLTGDAGMPLRVVVTGTGTRAGASAASAPTAPVSDPPSLLAAPVVSGVAKRGRTLTATAGTWSNAAAYDYRWQRLTGDTWADVDGATSAAYVAGAGDVGHALRVRVTASNPTGSATAFSAPTAAVADLQPPVNVAEPAVAGALYEGETLTVGGDGWTGATSTSVVWQRRTGTAEWAAISGQTERTYTLAAADVGADVRAVVTALNEDGETSRAAAARGPVDGDPVNTVPPSVAGTPRVGQALVASPGTWLRATSFTYAWERQDGGTWTTIPGATEPTYTPAAADRGLPLRVRVTGGGSRASTDAVSAATAPVLSRPVNVTRPVVVGVARVGQKLTASGDVWQHADTLRVRWQRRAADGDWTTVEAADARDYVVQPDDAGAFLRVAVVADNPYGDAVALSDSVGPVAAAPVADPDPTPSPTATPVASPAPTVTPAPVEQAAPPARAPVRLEVILRSGRKPAGKLTVTVTGTSAAVSGTKLKLRPGAYTARFCAGRRCVNRRLKVVRGRLKTRVTLPSASGTIAIKLTPRRGKAATGRLVLAR